MTIDTEDFIAIADMDEWADFVEANADDIDAIGQDVALSLALNCNLIMGGGAAPLFRIGFVD